MWRVVPGSSVYFFLLDKTTTAMKTTMKTPNSTTLPVHLSLLSAALARSVASVLFLPFTVVKTRFEAMGAERPYRSTLHAMQTISRVEGLRALWTGLVPTLLRDVPHSALYFAMYNYMKSVILPLRSPESRIPVVGLNFVAGMISGLTATVVSHPFDVVRTRLQTQYGSTSPRGMIDMTWKMVKVRLSGGYFSLTFFTFTLILKKFKKISKTNFQLLPNFHSDASVHAI